MIVARDSHSGQRQWTNRQARDVAQSCADGFSNGPLRLRPAMVLARQAARQIGRKPQGQPIGRQPQGRDAWPDLTAQELASGDLSHCCSVQSGTSTSPADFFITFFWAHLAQLTVAYGRRSFPPHPVAAFQPWHRRCAGWFVPCHRNLSRFCSTKHQQVSPPCFFASHFALPDCVSDLALVISLRCCPPGLREKQHCIH